MYTRGNWGGIIVLGNAPVKGGSKNIEGLARRKYTYGGSNIGDSSGVLQYVRAWHGGARIGADNEINGITFGGVGSGTVLDHCEVALNLDDGFEFFGGTVNGKYLSSLYVGDDSFDTDKGYQGKMQYLFTMLGKAGHHGCEMDGDKTSVKSFMTKSAPQVMGLTVIGSSTNSDQDTMMKLHEGTAGAFGNMVLAPMKKLPAIKHSKCSQADGVRTVQKRSPGQLVANFEGVLYVAPNIVMHEVYPSAFREQCATGLYKAKMLDNLNANAAKTGAVCTTKQCAGNTNGDSKIDVEDLLNVLGNYGKKGC
jgi:hypothetical protein